VRSVRMIALLLVAVLIPGLGTVAPAALSAPDACEGTWNIVPSPNPDPDEDFDNGFASLAVVSPTDIWAVGNSGIYGETRRTLVEHWNGSSWSMVPSPNGPNEVNWLLGADAVSASNVWAVGYSATNPPFESVSDTLIERWNGSSWSVVPSPNPEPPLAGGPVSNELYGVDAVSANDVWAVGLTHDLSVGQTLIVHWNGATWSVVPSPSPGEYGWLRSVSAVSANDVWAVGTHYVNGLQLTLILHWNGSTWSVVPSPNDGPFLQELFKVRATSANDVWAVGYHLAVFGFNQVFQTSIFHWNGTQWSVVPSPDVNQLNNYLWSVDGTSATDAWAVGFYDTGTELRTMTQHWDGAAWTIQPSPNASTYITELTDVAALSPTDVWSIGEYVGFFHFRTLTMHRTTSCGGATMHVEAITPRFRAQQALIRTAVVIRDAGNAAVSDASVTVVITKPGGSQETQTRPTNARGKATFSTTATTSGTYTFTVTGVVKSGFTYDPSANSETSDSIVVP
jgi:hypothetical protein